MDVVLIRLTLIFLLVFFHAFTPFTGNWPILPCEDFHVIETYKWVGLLSHYSQLEAMVFISGLLFGHTLALHPEDWISTVVLSKRQSGYCYPACYFPLFTI